MFVTVWKICLFLVFFNVFAVWQSPVQYEASWQGLSVVWVFLLLVHSSELQPVGCVGGWECHLWVCDKWKGHFCQALQHRPGNGSWDSGKSGFQRTKRWADRPVNPLVRCATFSPFQCFYQAKPKLLCVQGCQAKGSQAQHPQSAWHHQGMWGQPQGQHSILGGSGVFKSFQGPAVSWDLIISQSYNWKFGFILKFVAEVLGCWTWSLLWLVLKQRAESVPVSESWVWRGLCFVIQSQHPSCRKHSNKSDW